MKIKSFFASAIGLVMIANVNARDINTAYCNNIPLQTSGWDEASGKATLKDIPSDVAKIWCAYALDATWGSWADIPATWTPGSTTIVTGRIVPSGSYWKATTAEYPSGVASTSKPGFAAFCLWSPSNIDSKNPDCTAEISPSNYDCSSGTCQLKLPTYCNNFRACVSADGKGVQLSGLNNHSPGNFFAYSDDGFASYADITPTLASGQNVIFIDLSKMNYSAGPKKGATIETPLTGILSMMADALGPNKCTADNNGASSKNGIDLSTAPICDLTPTDTQAPTPPSGLQSSSIGPTGFTISWTASFDNVGVTAYDIYVNGKLHTNSTSTSKVLTGLTLGTSYIINIKARDASGNTSISSKALEVTTSTTDPQAPTTPSNLTATFVSDLSVTVKWNKSTSIHGINWYDVYKDGAWYANTTDTTISITGLQVTTTYSITIKAKDNAGKSSASSNELQVTTKKESQPPTKPSGVMNTEPTQNSFTVSWTASSDNIAVTEYRVYLNGIPYGSSPSNVQLLVNLNPATTYTVTVSAFDAAGNESLKSDPIIVNTLATNIENIGHSKLNIFPNPFKDVLNIANNSFTKYYIYDMNNILLASGEITSNQLSLSQLTSGMYILKLSDENNSIYTKIIKE